MTRPDIEAIRFRLDKARKSGTLSRAHRSGRDALDAARAALDAPEEVKP